MRQERPYNLLALSDLHLGCDVRAGAPRGADPRRDRLDRTLVRFLDQHALARADGRPWRLLLLGDVFDFVGVTLLPPDGLSAPFPVDAEERRIGLAPEEAKCAWKLSRIAARHEEVFHALARFLVAGNELHFVRGNHDAELHWPAVQAELRRLLGKRAGLEGASLRALEQRVCFHAWFYLEPGFLYAEHGNAHDRYCLQSGFFDELPGGERELELPMSSKVLRYFANAWAEQQEELDKADQWGVADFLAWVVRMGNPLRIAADYFIMVFQVLQPIAHQSLRLSRMAARSTRRALRRLDEERRLATVQGWLSRFSEDAGRQAAQLLAIASRPAEQSLFDAAQLFYVDRMLLAAASLAAAAAGLWLAPGLQKLAWLLGVGLFFAAANAPLAGRRRTDAHSLLLDAARRVAQLFDARTVVMGHSHRALDLPVGPGQRYLNLGSWTPEDGRLPHLAAVGSRCELRWFRERGAVAVVSRARHEPLANVSPPATPPSPGPAMQGAA